MSDWSNYLKKAVASVEQRLDQVLQDGSELPTFKQQKRNLVQNQEPITETSSEDQLDDPVADTSALIENEIVSDDQNASPGETAPETVDKTTASKLEDLKNKELKLINTDIEVPDTLQLKILAEKLASSALTANRDQVNERAAELAEATVVVAKTVDKFNLSCKDRLIALHSRLELATKDYLDGEHSDTGAKLAQLLNEGQRLSRRELELGQQVKLMKAKLTEDMKSTAALTTSLQTSEQKVTTLSAKLKETESACQELKANKIELEKAKKENSSLTKEVEDLKIQLAVKVETHKQERSQQRAEEFKLRAELQEALALLELFKSTSAPSGKEDGSFRQNSFLEEESSQSDAWAEKEMNYLASISSLEADVQSASIRERRLLEKTKTLEHRLEEEKDSHEALQSKVDSLAANVVEARGELEAAKTHYRTVESDLNSKIVGLEHLADELKEANNVLRHDLEAAHEEAKSAAEASVNAPAPSISVMDRFLNSEIVADRPSPEPLLAMEERKYAHASQNTTRQATPSSYPIGEHPLAGSSIAVGDISLQSISDQQFSHTDLAHSARYQILSKLKLQVSKLESELITAREASDVYMKERDSAKRELVDLFEKFNAADAAIKEHEQCTAQISSLESRILLLEKSLQQKEEITNELQADIADLKEIHQDQINLLIGELQKSKVSSST